ncbi:hypothetical protein MHUMG1_03513 [Metarhizium humberi]|uniref:Uncharacterized protein n=1 Tax=Metarhizium humberi TaxID=2596975 RepID=A0A9P8S9D3_9HYPO|nr:hypothetical protein MHUMG1_03513 [Metarhizium humberi]
MRSSGGNDGRAEWFGNTVQFTTIQVGRRQPFYPTHGSLPQAADAMADIHSSTDTAASALPRAHRVSASRHGLLLRENLFLHKPPQWFNRTPRHNLRHALHGSDAIQRPRCVVHHGSGEISGLGAATTRLLPTKAGALPQGCLVDLVRRAWALLTALPFRNLPSATSATGTKYGRAATGADWPRDIDDSQPPRDWCVQPATAPVPVLGGELMQKARADDAREPVEQRAFAGSYILAGRPGLARDQCSSTLATAPVRR